MLNAVSDVALRTWRLGRKIARDPAGFASLLALLLGMVLALLPMPNTWNVAFEAVGYSIVGGAIFSFLYQFWANDALVRVIDQKIVKSQRRIQRELKNDWTGLFADASGAAQKYFNDLSQLHRRHWPLHVFPAGSHPNPSFNERINTALLDASRYDFRGQTGKHLASRLNQVPFPRLQYIRAIIEDATIAEVMNARITERRAGDPQRFGRISDADLEQIILEDMLDSLIGLFISRSKYHGGIDVVYAPRPTDVRVEIVQETVFVSPFVRNRPEGGRYPEVYCYAPQSLPAQLALLEFEREFSILGRHQVVQFQASMAFESFLRHVNEKGWSLTPEALNDRIHRAQGALRTLGNTIDELPEPMKKG